MPLNALEQNTIFRAITVAQLILEKVKPQLDSLNIIYDAVGGAKETITQQSLDEMVINSGLTKTQLDDGIYILTAILRPVLLSGFTQLAQLAARA